MTDIDRLDQRLSAVERVVVDGDVALEELSTLASLVESVDELDSRLEDQERRLADLESSVQSVEGYVGNVESVNADVERQATSAIATVDRLERRVDKLEVELDDLQGGLLQDEPTDTVEEERSEGHDDDSEDIVAADDPSGFEFQFPHRGSTSERSVEEILEDESRSVVDDGTDRPVSSANQTAVDSAVDGDESSTNDADPDAADGSLFGSLRSKLS